MFLLLFSTFVISFGFSKAQDPGNELGLSPQAQIRGKAVFGKREYGERCESESSIDSIYHDLQLKSIDDPRISQLESAMCKEHLNLRCLRDLEKRTARGDVNSWKYSCQCYDPIDPNRIGRQLVYDYAAGECRAKVRFGCDAYPVPDKDVVWRYDRKPFTNIFQCVTFAECVNSSRKLAHIFQRSEYSLRCTCLPGYLPNDTGHCHRPGETKFPEQTPSFVILFIAALVSGFALQGIYEIRLTQFAEKASCSLRRYFNVDFLGFLDNLELPKHWYNSDGTEKSYLAIKQMLLLKKHIFEMKHTCFWKFGVFVRFEDNMAEIQDTKDSSAVKLLRKRKKENQNWSKNVSKENAINAMDKRLCKNEFTFVREYQDKKNHYSIRSCLNKDNELFIRHISEVSDKEFLKFISTLSVPKDYPYCSYITDDFQTQPVEDIEEDEHDLNIVIQKIKPPDTVSYTRKGLIKLSM